jgi:molybdopterin-guanine dinucleotide biosynthesis protein B
MAGPPFVIHIIGLTNTGKSGLMESLIQELNKLGIKAGVLKHDGSGHFHWDREGTDTHRIRAAGSPVTAILSDREFAIHAADGLDITLPEIMEVFFNGFDILLVEGLKRLKGKKVEVLREGVSTHPLSKEEDLVATFGDRLFDRDVPHFDQGSVRDLAELIYQLLIEQSPKRSS